MQYQMSTPFPSQVPGIHVGINPTTLSASWIDKKSIPFKTVMSLICPTLSTLNLICTFPCPHQLEDGRLRLSAINLSRLFCPPGKSGMVLVLHFLRCSGTLLSSMNTLLVL